MKDNKLKEFLIGFVEITGIKGMIIETEKKTEILVFDPSIIKIIDKK